MDEIDPMISHQPSKKSYFVTIFIHFTELNRHNSLHYKVVWNELSVFLQFLWTDPSSKYSKTIMPEADVDDF